MDDQTARRFGATETESLFRAINERIEQLNETFDALTPYGSWVCECPRTTCIERIDMTLAEYEAVRAHPARFAVYPSAAHVVAEVDRVVSRDDRYWVVEKLGVAADRATELTPR